MVKKNSSGNCTTKYETQIYDILESYYLPKNFTQWENISNKSIFHNGYKPDYRAKKQGMQYYIEVEKNEFTVKSYEQVMKYIDFFARLHGINNFKLILINKNFDKIRKEFLKRLEVIELLTISDILPEESVLRWM